MLGFGFPQQPAVLAVQSVLIKVRQSMLKMKHGTNQAVFLVTCKPKCKDGSKGFW